MESSEKENKKSKKNVIPILIIAVLLVAVAGLAAALVLGKDKEEPGGIQYASNATVILSEADMQAAAANSTSGNVGLRYRNDAFSTDGRNFSCYIVNSGSNAQDAFFTIFADADMTDQLFLSGLVPPGSGFENITLDRELPKGDHEVQVAVTLVETDENGEQSIVNQVIHTMDFHVS